MHAHPAATAHDPDDGANPDQLELLTVGIDIGTSTSHLMLSRLVVRRLGKGMQSRWIVSERRTVFLSPVILTPYRGDFSIDAAQLEEFFTDSFRQAGVAPEAIDTGAVLLTGEAVRRRNARAIADLFAHTSGRFVCATAGHHLEALVSGYGSGAVTLAQRTGEAILNIDIGGGTSKFAFADGGKIRLAAAVNVGGRLLAYDRYRRITRIEPAAREIANWLGIPLLLGDALRAEDGSRIVEAMADCLAEAIQPGTAARRGTQARPGTVADLSRRLLLTDPLPACKPERITISGGVAEYLRDPSARAFGDLGPQLAARVAERLAKALGVPVEPAAEQLRATVVGLSQFTVQVSGDTIFIEDNHLLPLRNLPVVSIRSGPQPAAAEITELTRQALRRRELYPAEQPLALFVHWQGRPVFSALQELALGITEALAAAVTAGHPLVVCISQDCAQGLGHLLARRLANAGAVVCVDGLELGDFDFVDIGARVAGKQVVPVVVKSLIFPQADPAGSEIKQEG